jgi:CRP-like cAMP-binding protein
MEANPAVYYRAWGADNVAYGPVELPTLVSWIRDGRVLPQTWIYNEESGAWARAADLPELKGLLRPKGAPTSAPTAAASGIKPGSLRRIKIFAEMDDPQLASFLQYIEVLKYPQFSDVVKKGQHGDAMFLVLEGELRARVMIDNKESTLSTMTVGECFGELALIDEGPRSADVVANKESVLLKISAGALKRLFQEAPALAAPFLFGLTRAIASRVRMLTKRYEDSIHFARTASEREPR